MTTGLDPEKPDFLTHCQAARTGSPVLEQIRSRGADAVLCVFRLTKNGFVHALDNQAVLQSAAQARQILADFAAMIGGNVSITFIGDTIFVCGQLLRASRLVYESAMELGEIFDRCNLSELTIDGDVSAEDLVLAVSVVVQSHRNPDRRDELLATKVPHVALRKVEAQLSRRENDEAASLEDRILRVYATSLVVLRGFFDDVACGATILPHRVKRLSQQLVSLTGSGDAGLLGLTAMANSQRDDAARAVLSAVVALVIGRRITHERVPLARLTMAALMADAGRIRLMGAEGRDSLIALTDMDEERVPAATATVCVATGGVNVVNALRTVVTTEVTWLERERLLGPVYQNEITPLVETQILRVARALIDQLSPRDAAVAPKSPLEAIEAVASTKGVDTTLLRLFVASVGILPTTSVVEFETGEWAVVLGPSATPGALDRPIVRLVTDRHGRPLRPPREVDLGAALPGTRAFPRIVNVLPPTQARFNVTRVFLG